MPPPIFTLSWAAASRAFGSSHAQRHCSVCSALRYCSEVHCTPLPGAAMAIARAEWLRPSFRLPLAYRCRYSRREECITSDSKFRVLTLMDLGTLNILDHLGRRPAGR